MFQINNNNNVQYPRILPGPHKICLRWTYQSFWDNRLWFQEFSYSQLHFPLQSSCGMSKLLYLFHLIFAITERTVVIKVMSQHAASKERWVLQFRRLFCKSLIYLPAINWGWADLVAGKTGLWLWTFRWALQCAQFPQFQSWVHGYLVICVVNTMLWLSPSLDRKYTCLPPGKIHFSVNNSNKVCANCTTKYYICIINRLKNVELGSERLYSWWGACLSWLNWVWS